MGETRTPLAYWFHIHTNMSTPTPSPTVIHAAHNHTHTHILKLFFVFFWFCIVNTSLRSVFVGVVGSSALLSFHQPASLNTTQWPGYIYCQSYVALVQSNWKPTFPLSVLKRKYEMLLYSYNRFISVIFLDIHLLKVGNREHCVDVIVICIIMC